MPLKYKALSGGFTSPYLERIRNNATVGQLKIQANSLTALYKKISHQEYVYFFLQGLDSLAC
jgi:folylpolyglutamate synthase/dihydropteroate synthase